MAYHVDKYEEALRELRTHRRISGSDDNLPLIADAERGRGRPQKALEIFSEASEEALGHDLYTELLMVAAGAHMDRGEVAEARALLETRNFAGNASGTLVRLLSVYSDVIRLQGDAELAGRYEELARRTAKATGTLFGDEDPDLNANVEIVTLEELELPDDEPDQADEPKPADEPGQADTSEQGDESVSADTGESAEQAESAEQSEPVESTEPAIEPVGEVADEPAVEEGALEDGSSESPTAEDPDEALRAVDAEFASETVDELEEILAATDDPVPAEVGSEKVSAAAQDDPPVTPETPEVAEAANTESAPKESKPKESKPKKSKPTESKKKEPEQDSAPDDYEELTEPLFDL